MNLVIKAKVWEVILAVPTDLGVPHPVTIEIPHSTLHSPEAQALKFNFTVKY